MIPLESREVPRSVRAVITACGDPRGYSDQNKGVLRLVLGLAVRVLPSIRMHNRESIAGPPNQEEITRSE